MSDYQNFPINSTTLLGFMFLKGVMSMLKRANVCMTCTDGDLRLKLRKT